MAKTPVIEALRTAARAIESADDREVVRAVQVAQDALDLVKAERLAAIEETLAFELDGASSLVAWSRQHLRLDPHETKALLRSVRACRELPAVAAAAEAGLVRAGHLAWLDYGVRHLGAELMLESEPWLVDVATVCPPSDLRQVVRALRDAIYPDDLDQAWVRGMDREDIQVNAVPDGFSIKGFLNTVTGAKLRAVLESLGAPRSAEDTRTGGERRVQGLDALLTTVLEAGLPSDKGVRPHLSVIVDAETLAGSMGEVPKGASTPPAELVGFGPIGPRMLSYLGCISDVTALLTLDRTLEQSKVLNVGRTSRLATMKQRRALIALQRGVCATPGCHNTHLEIHHIDQWAEGGRTDLDRMVGLCARCHRLLHRDLLRIVKHASGTVTFVDRNNRPLKRTELQLLSSRRRVTRVRQQHHASAPLRERASA